MVFGWIILQALAAKGDWPYYVDIAVVAGKVVSEQTNFPMLISQTNLPAEFWSHVRPDGMDIVFTATSVTHYAAGTPRYSREMVSINAAHHTLECYVSLPLLATGTACRLWIGGSSIPNDTNVWSADFEFASHFENASSLYDSTGKRTMTPIAPLTNLPGPLGNAVYLSNKQINLSDTNTLNVNYTIYTIVRQRTVQSFTPFFTVAGSGNGGYNLRTWGTGGKVGFTHIGVADESFNYILPLNTWTHIAFIMNGASQVLYINGSSVDTKTYPFLKLPLGYIGAINYADFDVDMLIAVKRVLASNDVATLYNSLNPGFYAVGELRGARRQQSRTIFF